MWRSLADARRVVAGSVRPVFVERLVGASAERGDTLADVAALGRRVNDRARSFGIALRSCSPLTLGRPAFELADDEIEIGVGIHGEPGRPSRQDGTCEGSGRRDGRRDS